MTTDVDASLAEPPQLPSGPSIESGTPERYLPSSTEPGKSESDVGFRTDGNGCLKIVWDSGEREVPLSHLIAIADGADPYELFGDSDVVAHHLLNSGMKVDCSENIEILDRESHSRLHANGYDPDVDVILWQSSSGQEEDPS